MKKRIRIMSCILMVALSFYLPTVVAKAKPTLAVKSKTMTVGQRYALKLKNVSSKAKVKWKSSKRSVAAITGKKGNTVTVRAKKTGTATISATYKKRTYKCCVTIRPKKRQRDYGVFLSLDSSSRKKIAKYRTVVIDAQFFSKKDIAYLKAKGCTVYSYINIGAIENFRKYYSRYSHLALGDYENWDEEKWMDVSSVTWQKFLVSLEKQLLKKGIDGFFVDNCDVYYQYPTKEIFQGVTIILEHLMEYKKPVIINGGDTFVMKYRNRYGTLQPIMTGVNQESVWSRIDFARKKLSAQSKDTRQYYIKYINTCKKEGMDVYLTEYTTSSALKKKIARYCKKNKFHYYIADSIELD